MLKTKISSFLERVTSDFFCLSEPAAASTVALALKGLVLPGSYGPYRVTREEGNEIWLEATANADEEDLKILRITLAS